MSTSLTDGANSNSHAYQHGFQPPQAGQAVQQTNGQPSLQMPSTQSSDSILPSSKVCCANFQSRRVCLHRGGDVIAAKILEKEIFIFQSSHLLERMIKHTVPSDLGTDGELSRNAEYPEYLGSFVSLLAWILLQVKQELTNVKSEHAVPGHILPQQLQKAIPAAAHLSSSPPVSAQPFSGKPWCSQKGQKSI